MKKAVVILPTFNEAKNVTTLVPAIFSQEKYLDGWQIHILVVDDNSPDHTAQEINRLQKKYSRLYLILGKKQGLGRAYIRGFQYCLDNLSPEAIFEMDADWSHPPKLIPEFLKRIDAGADFIIGTRYIKGGSIPEDWELYRKLFSYLGNLVIRLGFMDLKVHDWTSGYRAIRTSFIRSIIDEMGRFNGYVFQVALLDKAIKMHLKIDEIPLRFEERKTGASKINSLQYIYNTLHYVFLNSSFIKFAIVGIIGFIVNALGLEFFFRLGFTPGVAAAMGGEVATVSNFTWNNLWSFRHKKIAHDRGILSKFIQFNTVAIGAIAIQSIVVWLGTHFFGDHTRLIFLILGVTIFVIPYSYFMYNKFIWTHE